MDSTRGMVMRQVSVAALCAALCLGAAPAVKAAPLLTMEYSIGALSRALQFMGDGSVRIACDGSVLVACDGSVTPVANALAEVSGDGSVRLRTQITLFGDGSVRVGDGSVMPGQDALLLDALSFSPNPFIEALLGVTDFGAASTFLVTFGGPLTLGTNAFTYDLTGSATLTDASGDGITIGAVAQFGLPNGLIAGVVDGLGVASTGGTLAAEGTFPLTPASGSESCVGCAFQLLAFGFEASGGGDQYAMSGRFDINPVSVPAPAPLGLLAAGLVMLGLVRRRA